MNRLNAEDRLDINELLARYWQAVDSGDLEGFANTFTPDGVLENYTGTTQGRAALAQWLKDYEPHRIGNRHYSVNPIVTPTGADTADVWSYMVVLAAYEPRTDLPHVIAFGRFNDRLAKTDGRWHFQHRLLGDLVLNAKDYGQS